MKAFTDLIRATPIEAYILFMLAIVAVGSGVSVIVERQSVGGDGTFIGADVRDNGTNPWQ